MKKFNKNKNNEPNPGVRSAADSFGYHLGICTFKVFTLSMALLLFPIINSYTQIKPGIIAGYNHAIFGGPDAKAWGFMDEDPMFAARFHLGGFILAELLEDIYAEPGLMLSSRGTRYVGERELINPDNNQFYTAELTLQKKLLYLSFPLTIRYYLMEKLSIAAGPELSILLSAKAVSSDSEFGDPITTDVLEEYNKLDISLRLALTYLIAKNLFLQFGYLHGLNDIVKYEEYGSYTVMNRMLQLSLAYTLNPLKEKK